jgi:hypothetical protein
VGKVVTFESVKDPFIGVDLQNNMCHHVSNME